MSSDVNSDHADKIRKLLTMAEDPNLAEPAREAYRNKALELMTLWAIDDVILQVKKQSLADNVKDEYLVFSDVPKIYQPVIARLAAGVITAFGGSGIVITDKTRCMIQVVAFEQDMQRLQSITLSIVRQAILAFASWTRSDAAKNALYGRTAAEKYNVRRSFFMGFRTAVTQRIRDLFTEHTEGEPGTALVLADRRSLLNDYVNNMSGIRPGTALKYNVQGAVAGSRAGARADIGQTTVSNGTRVLSLGQRES